SSRRRHTRFSRDWSSDVCSSDLDFFNDNSAMLTEHAREEIAGIPNIREKQLLTIYVPAVDQIPGGQRLRQWEKVAARSAAIADRSEERRVGKACSAGWVQ